METVITSYHISERHLGDMLRFVPYCREHENVWSPELATVLSLAGNQLDSLWRAEVSALAHGKDRDGLNIVDYFQHVGKRVSPKWVVCWAEEGKVIRPFVQWEGRSAYAPLEWWTAYTDLKHDQFAHLRKATLKNAIEAVAGLFVAILSCEFCLDAMAAAGWLSGTWPELIEEALANDLPDSPELDRLSAAHVAVESKLFARPVCWFGQMKLKHWNWTAHASDRFRCWWSMYEHLPAAVAP